MAEARRKCDHDFREGAVRIVRETGKPIAQVARELRQRGHPGELGDAGPASVGHWERGIGEDERAELARLRRECAELRMRLAMDTRATLMPTGSGSSGRWNWRPGCTRRGQPRQRRRRR